MLCGGNSLAETKGEDYAAQTEDANQQRSDTRELRVAHDGGQVSKLTGVTTRALQHYDEKGLLCPRRSGEGVANNRKLYSPEDVDRLKQIVVLGSYGFELKDMPPILDGERSLTDALAERIEELRAQERYLQHLILFARYAEIVGDDLFETLAFGTSEVDAFAELMRSSPAYADKAIRWESMDDAGLEQLWDELGAIIVDFLGGDDEDPFAHIESTVRRLRAWFCTYFFEIDDLDLLGIWTLFEDGSEEAEFAGEVGGEATPGFLQSAVFLVWLKSMILELSAMIEAGAGDDMGSSFSENRAVSLVDFVCRSCGYPVPEAAELDADEWDAMVEFFETVAGYLRSALEDEETMALIDPDGESAVDGAFFERAARAAREVELFSERS